MVTSLLDHPALASSYFFPRRDPPTDPFFVVAADGTTRLACHRSAPFSDALTLLHFHGNAEVVADYVPIVSSIINALGVNVVFAEYRGYGASTGTASLGRMLDDVEAVFAATGVPANRIVPFGRSLGSLFAVEACARHPDAAGLVIESGIADPLEPKLVRVSPQELGTSREALEEAVRERLDQKAKLAGFRGPLLVLHTLADALIAPSHGERIASWGGARAEHKRLVLFERGDH